MASVNARLAILTLLITVFGTGLLLWTFDETRETSRRELRAYLYTKTMDLLQCQPKNFPAVDAHAEQRFVRVAFQNYGASPARDVGIELQVSIDQFPLQAALVSGELDSDLTSRSDIPQNREVGMDLEVPRSGALHSDLMKGGVAVYCWGEISYKDIFGRPHVTHLRLVSQGIDYRQGRFRPMLEGNQSD